MELTVRQVLVVQVELQVHQVMLVQVDYHKPLEHQVQAEVLVLLVQ